MTTNLEIVPHLGGGTTAQHIDGDATLSALTSPALEPLFWKHPRPALPSAWHAHVPFAFWIVQALRPRILVELGTHYGISYAAFCEAVINAHLGTRCYAIDTWKGDVQAGHYAREIFRHLRAFHNSRYSGFSELLRMTLDVALPNFADGSVDLLHIDGLHTYEAVRHDFQQWLPKLSDRAVVLFHDINVREGDFGVWKFWEELRRERQSFAFLHEHGLGVLLFGAHLPPEVLALGGCDESATNLLRDRFAALGQRYALEAALTDAERTRSRDG